MIEKVVNENLVQEEPAAVSLIQFLDSIDRKRKIGEASLYHHFPLYPGDNSISAIKANLLLLTKSHGLYIFQSLSVSNRGKVDFDSEINNLSAIDRIVYAKIFRDSPSLQKSRRELKFEIFPYLFVHDTTSGNLKIDTHGLSIVSSERELEDLIFSKNYELTPEEYRDLKATIEGSKGIPRVSQRKLKNPEDFKNSRGAILTLIENDIYNFDNEQKRAALFTLDGAQRIRGLAGSGKTIILAMKAAQIHLQDPTAEILYTYWTKALRDLVKSYITRFYRQFAERDPNWDKVHIMHAWGGYGLQGVYSTCCKFNSLPTVTFREAALNRPDDPFDYVCEELNKFDLQAQFDFCLMDEAQDFPTNFYRLCRKITRNNRVVWAYDDFQNILDVKIQDEKETFGKDEKGNYYIDFSKKTDELQDIVLHKCYRNPRKNLLAAFALGLGIYNSEGRDVKMVQRLENNSHWEGLGFTVEQGSSKVGDQMVISRSAENSPLLKNEYLSDDVETLKVISFSSLSEEVNEVCKMIEDDLSKELKPEDINIISLDDRNAKAYFSDISENLNKRKIKTFNLSTAPNDNIVYKVKDHVTLSTIYRAKGNEAGSVYIVGIDATFRNKYSIIERNKLFTALTRSTAWVTLTGILPSAAICGIELNFLRNHDFKLVFTQPSEDEVVTIREGLSERQKILNQINRLAEQYAKLSGQNIDEIIKDLKAKFFVKK